MPNVLDQTGLTLATTDEIASALQANLQAIYGADINLLPNSPDGQMTGIYSQADTDVLDILMDVYNSFDVDAAYGIQLQRLVALNGMTIKSGSQTTTVVNVVVSDAGTLYGLDQTAQTIFALTDPNNTWQLVSTHAFGGAGNANLVFQCTEIGPVSPLPNTIVNQATSQPFVTAVNNPTVVTSGVGVNTVVGQYEETDPQLRARHAQSFFLAATGPADACEAQLLDQPDILDAIVVQNNTAAPVAGQPANSVWPIVVGGTPAEIAGIIYSTIDPGCPTYGAQSYTVIRPNGQGLVEHYDVGAAQTLYASFQVVSNVPGITFDTTLLASQLAAAAVGYWKLNKSAGIGDLVRLMFKIEPRATLVSPGVSTDGDAYSDAVSPASPKNYFTLTQGNIQISQ